jgi:predicted Ser/Thr protein kinase
LSSEAAQDELVRGEAVGRFVLLDLLGRGGMGEVYAAYDPQLDRKVAVKILQSRSHEGEARLLREAKTVAKLQHPNVVVVYEVGTFRDTVFIAMEFVEGRTLGAWLQAEARPWREILRVFQAAARGLAAAHEIGIIHRDFKPDNVMITKTGEVRVMDFGLARSVDMGPDDVAAPPAAAPALDQKLTDGDDTRALAGLARLAVADSQADAVKLTRTGMLLGTPAYMAPEQFAGGALDARTDQFSFCVALCEALYGARPFEGETFLSLMVNIGEGRVRPPPERSRVPSWLRRVVLRGLSAEPDARYPSMGALLAALDADPMQRRRRWLTTLGGAALLGSLALFAGRAGRGSGPVCSDGADRLAGVWEPAAGPSPRRDQVKRAFLATGKSFATQSYATAARLLDEYVGRWTSMVRENCEATRLRGAQSWEVLDLRTSCLADRLANVRALTEVFMSADEGVVTNAASAAGALPMLDRCADVAALRAVVKPPEDPATRRRVGELRDELAHVAALGASGQCRLAETRGQALIESVRATKYRPLLGEALIAVGDLGNECAAIEPSMTRLKEGYLESAAGGDDATSAVAASNAAVFLAVRLGQPAMARDWLLVARAAALRMSNPSRIQGSMLTAEQAVLGAEHEFEKAVSTAREAAAATAKTLGPDHPMSIDGLLNIGDDLSRAGRYAEAVAADEEALSAVRRVLGDEHPVAAMIYANECEALNRLRRFDEALSACGRAMSLWQVVRPDPFFLTFGQAQTGIALLGLGKPERASGPLEQAVAARVAAHAAGELLGEPRFALARALWPAAAQRPHALALARQARLDYTGDTKRVAEIDAWLAAPR